VRPSAEDKDLMLREWNAPPVRRPENALLHQLVEKRAEADPLAVAVCFDGEEMSYGALVVAADRVAADLSASFAVKPDAVVGLLLERGLELPIAMLAVLKAGGAWLPLDPLHPPERIAGQLADAGAVGVMTTTELAGSLPPSTPTLFLDEGSGRPGMSVPLEGGHPDQLAYVIYTSGSTGRPKGVMISHRSAVEFVLNAHELFRLRPGDRVLQFANPAFDVSVFDFFATLCSGATVVGAPRELLLDVDALQELMERERITVTDLPPAVLRLLHPEPLTELRALFVGLEAFPASLVNRWRTSEREFHNGYGPTEATVACVDYACPPEPLDMPPPIGRALPNHRCYVLDEDFEPVSIGVPGELYVAGTGLARGYLGRPDLTAECFLPDPFSTAGQRMYRTGDLVRWRPDGQLEFLGRTDRQVKIRGHRVELGEVEHALRECAGVSEGAVIAQDLGTPRAMLVAYVIAAPGTTPDGTAIRAQLTDRLPPYLVPSMVLFLDRFPLTASGKVDHARLPKPAPPVGEA
jgi:amino acid adenylation domain-containing protein